MLLALAVLAAGAAALLLLSSGDDGGLSSPLAWEAEPAVITPADLPRDRVTFGTIRNESLGPVRISAADLDVRDSEGRSVPHTARFIASFVHGLYGAFQQPDVMPAAEQERLGLLARLKPGEQTPLLVSVRLRDETTQPLRVYYEGRPVLEIPQRSTSG